MSNTTKKTSVKTKQPNQLKKAAEKKLSFGQELDALLSKHGGTGFVSFTNLLEQHGIANNDKKVDADSTQKTSTALTSVTSSAQPLLESLIDRFRWQNDIARELAFNIQSALNRISSSPSTLNSNGNIGEIKTPTQLMDRFQLELEVGSSNNDILRDILNRLNELA